MNTENAQEIVVDVRSWSERFVDRVDSVDLAESALASVLGAIVAAYILSRWL